MFRWVHLEIVCGAFEDYVQMGTFGNYMFCLCLYGYIWKLCVLLIVQMGTFGNISKEGGSLQRSL
jgi:hypothetical protein